MPIPKPKPGEKEKEFLDRCMSDPKMVEEYTPNKRYPICNAQFNKNKHKNNKPK